MTSYCVSWGSIHIVAAGFGSLGWVWVPGVPGGGCGPGGQEVFGGWTVGGWRGGRNLNCKNKTFEKRASGLKNKRYLDLKVGGSPYLLVHGYVYIRIIGKHGSQHNPVKHNPVNEIQLSSSQNQLSFFLLSHSP